MRRVLLLRGRGRPGSGTRRSPLREQLQGEAREDPPPHPALEIALWEPMPGAYRLGC